MGAMMLGDFLTTWLAVATRLRPCQALPSVVAGAALIFAVALPQSALALAGRTFVASIGSDANTATNCAVTAPCQTFAAAYSVTTAGGEIIALDSAGYGPLSITHSISIIGEHRAYIKPTPSTYGIIINAAPSDTIIIDNVEINGANGASTAGISIGSGYLILKNSVITRLTAGVTVANTKADIFNTDIVSNTYGIYTSGTGTDFSEAIPLFGPTQARLYSSRVLGNATAFYNLNPGSASGGNASLVTILLGDPNNRIVGNKLIVDGAGDGCPNGSSPFNNQCDNAEAFTTPTEDGQPQP